MTPNPSNPTQTEDWVTVPRDPTEAMIKAAIEEFFASKGMFLAPRLYRAMLSATPPQPSAAESETQ